MLYAQAWFSRVVTSPRYVLRIPSWEQQAGLVPKATPQMGGD